MKQEFPFEDESSDISSI